MYIGLASFALSEFSTIWVSKNFSIAEIPSEFALVQNYPNPFNGSTIITFTLPKSGNVNISIYDLAGNKIAEVVNKYFNVGKYTVNFTPNFSVASGVYFYKLTTGTDIFLIEKMLYIKCLDTSFFEKTPINSDKHD